MTDTTTSRFPVIREGVIGADRIQTVDARELHRTLEVGRDFATWIKDRIARFDFTPHVDFVTIEAAPQNGGAGNRGARTEYALSIEMAKEIAMVENNEIGRATRRYFLACERRAKAVAPAVPTNFVEALRLAADQAAQLEAQAGTIAAQAPKVDAYARIAEADGSLCITDAAKNLQIQPKLLFSFLRSNAWIYQRTGCTDYLGYQNRVQTGLLEHKVKVITRGDSTERTCTQVRITPKGLARLAEEFALA
ncbi:phage antirepressor KilAC domain-containing protein [Methylobacterium thuringiense]|uniref:Phage antirepressor Ant n=1 Tax=Methylobacterium thuringiense TaxID=1003091 RepID=A0ABQ4TJY0_9HYPH|nr:phage antirepressor KilAC domain-containing protein [Methylobacterium thuringiense]GJE54559.1 hypothetical protein EKPJFOCH_1037 [Methylobacterium thuringiense]